MMPPRNGPLLRPGLVSADLSQVGSLSLSRPLDELNLRLAKSSKRTAKEGERMSITTTTAAADAHVSCSVMIQRPPVPEEAPLSPCRPFGILRKVALVRWTGAVGPHPRQYRTQSASVCHRHAWPHLCDRVHAMGPFHWLGVCKPACVWVASFRLGRRLRHVNGNERGERRVNNNGGPDKPRAC